jgi:cytochrome P450
MLAETPDNVPEERVVDFDIYNIPGSNEDVQLAYRAFQQRHPDIFWTPRNGGHWVATRAEDIETMQREYEHFSNARIVIPLMPPETPRQIPLEVDPPEHAAYRRVLTLALLPRQVEALDGKVREVTVELIESLHANGECEFIEAFAKQLPINVFLDLVDLPRADRALLLPLTEESVRAPTVERRQAAHEGVAGYLMKWILARRETPGQDLLSKIVNTDINGSRISLEEAISFSVLVLFGGLDTVATMLGFIARFLALNPAHRQQIAENLQDEKFLRNAIEELIRRHGISNTARILTADYDYKGVSFRKGDLVLPPNLLFGLDERKVTDPLNVDFSRPFPPPHAAFGHGPHSCPGAMLARREIRIFLQEWLTRIPDYEITAGTTPAFGTGMVNGILSLNLSWPV